MTWKNYRDLISHHKQIKFLVTSRIVGSKQRKDWVSNGLFDYYVYISLSVFRCCSVYFYALFCFVSPGYYVRCDWSIQRAVLYCKAVFKQK